MNSMGVSPYVNNLYSDLCDGLIIFQLYDIIKPGSVDWDRVHKTFHKLKVLMEKIGQCLCFINSIVRCVTWVTACKITNFEIFDF